jgi:hypothetical protein
MQCAYVEPCFIFFSFLSTSYIHFHIYIACLMNLSSFNLTIVCFLFASTITLFLYADMHFPVHLGCTRDSGTMICSSALSVVAVRIRVLCMCRIVCCSLVDGDGVDVSVGRDVIG